MNIMLWNYQILSNIWRYITLPITYLRSKADLLNIVRLLLFIEITNLHQALMHPSMSLSSDSNRCWLSWITFIELRKNLTLILENIFLTLIKECRKIFFKVYRLVFCRCVAVHEIYEDNRKVFLTTSVEESGVWFSGSTRIISAKFGREIRSCFYCQPIAGSF